MLADYTERLAQIENLIAVEDWLEAQWEADRLRRDVTLCEGPGPDGWTVTAKGGCRGIYSRASELAELAHDAWRRDRERRGW